MQELGGTSRLAGFARTVAFIAASLVVTTAVARPSNLDLSPDRSSDNGTFQVQVVSGQIPIPMSRVHMWSLRLSGRDGAPVFGATVKVDGGMPEHGHGLPTAPQVEPTTTPGHYVLKGMKFSMPGWWVLKLDIRAPDGRTDKVTFNLVL